VIVASRSISIIESFAIAAYKPDLNRQHRNNLLDDFFLRQRLPKLYGHPLRYSSAKPPHLDRQAVLNGVICFWGWYSVAKVEAKGDFEVPEG